MLVEVLRIYKGQISFQSVSAIVDLQFNSSQSVKHKHMVIKRVISASAECLNLRHLQLLLLW